MQANFRNKITLPNLGEGLRVGVGLKTLVIISPTDTKLKKERK